VAPCLLPARSREAPTPLQRKAMDLVSFALPYRTLYTEYIFSLTSEEVVSATETLAGDQGPLDADKQTAADEAGFSFKCPTDRTHLHG